MIISVRFIAHRYLLKSIKNLFKHIHELELKKQYKIILPIVSKSSKQTYMFFCLIKKQKTKILIFLHIYLGHNEGNLKLT